jgi:hypothetical protein
MSHPAELTVTEICVKWFGLEFALVRKVSV